MRKDTGGINLPLVSMQMFPFPSEKDPLWQWIEVSKGEDRQDSLGNLIKLRVEEKIQTRLDILMKIS